MKTKPLCVMLQAAGLLLLLLASGCATTAMKGTPFFSGEYAGTKGLPEDRVNLWPLAYYNDPALSVLWPMGERTDTSLAFRPLFSLYRDKAGEPYSDLNILWPLSHFNLSKQSGDNHLFPVFWGSDYTVVFPLYWNLGKEVNSLFPFWIYDSHSSGYDLDLLWPLFNTHKKRDNHGVRLFPLFSHKREGSQSSFYSLAYSRFDGTTLIPPLLTWWNDREVYSLGGLFHQRNAFVGDDYIVSSAGHFIPLYAYDNADNSFYSLAYSHYADTTLIPPLLSWWDDSDVFALGGLFHQRYNAPDGKSAGHFLPFYAYDNADNSFYSLAYSRFGGTTLIPPLLSWRSGNAATGETDFYALGGLFHNRSGAPGGNDRSWLLPLYYNDSRNFVTPLWASGSGENGRSAWRVIPPLLSWQDTDPATEAKDIYALAGLFHQRYNAPDGKGAGHLLPLYAYDRKKDSFYSLAYSRFGNTTLIPPLLSWQSADPATGEKDFNALLGLFRQRYNAPGGKGAGHFFPLYAYDNEKDTFDSLLYCYSDNTTLIPPLLSWLTADPGTGAKDFYTLGGLFHQRYNAPLGDNKGWLFPLYAYDANSFGTDFFYTILYGHSWANGVISRYYLTPLVGSTHSDDENGFYIFPLVWHKTKGAEFSGDVLPERARALHLAGKGWQNVPPRHSSYDYFLLGLIGASHAQEFTNYLPSYLRRMNEMKGKEDAITFHEQSNSHVFPLWLTSSNKAIVFNDDATAIVTDTLEEKNSLLLFLYDYKREASQTENHNYTRRRVLWRLMHYEKLNGDVSLDIFPAVTWDKKADGSRKTSFLWRFFRYEKPAEGGAKLDVLFIPILR